MKRSKKTVKITDNITVEMFDTQKVKREVVSISGVTS